ncbi:MAG: Bax inhibitor-1/YccA family protein [Planctomycetes bacterium]|nr:Bax inhibitor-1/YccA family protein [Planctomycetota bacterium]
MDYNRNPNNRGYQSYGPVQGYGQQPGIDAGPRMAAGGYDDHVLMDNGCYEGDLANPAVTAFAKKVYAYFASALGVAAVAAFGGTVAVDHFISVGDYASVNTLWIGSLVTFIATYLIVVFSRKSRSRLKTGLLFVFAAAAGGTLAPSLMANVAAGMGMAIVLSFALAAVTFFGITVYVLSTGKDFRGIGGYLLIGVLVIVGLFLMSWFVSFPNLMTHAMMALGFVLFIGFTLYDTSRVVRDNFLQDDAVSAAINLLYDFVMLFRYALYFIGGGRD